MSIFHSAVSSDANLSSSPYPSPWSPTPADITLILSLEVAIMESSSSEGHSRRSNSGEAATTTNSSHAGAARVTGAADATGDEVVVSEIQAECLQALATRSSSAEFLSFSSAGGEGGRRATGNGLDSESPGDSTARVSTGDTSAPEVSHAPFVGRHAIRMAPRSLWAKNMLYDYHEATGDDPRKVTRRTMEQQSRRRRSHSGATAAERAPATRKNSSAGESPLNRRTPAAITSTVSTRPHGVSWLGKRKPSDEVTRVRPPVAALAAAPAAASPAGSRRRNGPSLPGDAYDDVMAMANSQADFVMIDDGENGSSEPIVPTRAEVRLSAKHGSEAALKVEDAVPTFGALWEQWSARHEKKRRTGIETGSSSDSLVQSLVDGDCAAMLVGGGAVRPRNWNGCSDVALPAVVATSVLPRSSNEALNVGSGGDCVKLFGSWIVRA
ncbi:hypothetical protein CLOM_g573 [Closterium sp. NIES-68]|nr:hypothetical protein CLOM_g573 [Closterium sp. NIES-68]GJP69138.1 hypothetical protein CLOP_g96 [Closterium sp. NIES-67]